MSPYISSIVETTSDHGILEKARSESVDRAANVDIMFSLFSDEPPILPLREECLSEGVELVYNANGAGHRAIYEEKKRRKAELLREIEHLETKLGGEERCHVKCLDHEMLEKKLKKDEWLAKVICARMKLTRGDASFGVSYQAYSKEVEQMNQARISDIQSCHSDDSIDALTNKVKLKRVDSVCIDRCPSTDTTPRANHGDYGVQGDAEASQNQIMSNIQEQTQENKSVEHEHSFTCTIVPHDYSPADTGDLTDLSLVSVTGRRIPQVECSDDSTQTSESSGNYFNDSVSRIIGDDFISRVSDASLESILGDDQDMKYWESRAPLDETEESRDTMYKDLILCIVSLLSFLGCVYNRDNQLLRLHLEKQMKQNRCEQCECKKLAEDVAKFVVKEIREDENKKVSGCSERLHKGSTRTGRDILSFVLFMACTFYRNTQATDLRLQVFKLKFALQALEIQQDSRDKLAGLMNEILSDAVVYRTQDPSQRMPSPSPLQDHVFFDGAPTNNHIHHKKKRVQGKRHNIPMFDFYYVNSMLD